MAVSTTQGDVECQTARNPGRQSILSRAIVGLDESFSAAFVLDDENIFGSDNGGAGEQ